MNDEYTENPDVVVIPPQQGRIFIWQRVCGPVYNKARPLGWRNNSVALDGHRRPEVSDGPRINGDSIDNHRLTTTGGNVVPSSLFPSAMLKGILLALGIMFLLMLIPIVDFVGIPFGPFIGAYYGMASVRASTGEVFPPGPPTGAQIGAFAIKGAIFGGVLGLLVSMILVVVGVILMLTIDLSGRFILLLWLAVVVFTMYAATMAALGAMYSQIRAAKAQYTEKPE